MLSSCSSPSLNLTAPDAAYRAALESTQDSAKTALKEGSDEEKQAIARLQDLFRHYTPEGITERIDAVYAEEVFFRDGFRYVTNRKDLLDYMKHGSEALRSSEFIFTEASVRDGNYYLPWTMRLNLNRDKPDEWSEVLGISHLRFNADGLIVFHQDYWDPTDVLWKRIPVAGWIIQKVRAKL